MSACLAQQEPLKVAFLGPEGTFTQQAVLKHFGHSVRALPLPSIERSVRGSAGGPRRLRRRAGRELDRRHGQQHARHVPDLAAQDLRRSRAAHPPAPDGPHDGLQKIVRVCSHPQSLAQCRHGCDEHLPKSSACRSAATPKRARRARDEDGTAAIAGEAAAEVYGLNVLVPEIEDRPDNTTRFLVIGRKLFSASGKDKTTLLVSAGDTQSPGALYRLLEPLAQQQHQHDAHRVAAVAQAQMGLRVLHRRRRPCRASSR